MNRSRLAPGAGIVTVPGAPVLRSPEGEFLRIDTGGVDGDVLARLPPGRRKRLREIRTTTVSTG